MVKKQIDSCCPPKPKIEERPLLSEWESTTLESTFKILANRTRLRLLHTLIRSGELCVSDLADTVGMKQQAVSNQLQRLTNQGIVASRRDGLQMYYRIIDPCVILLLDKGWCLSEDAQSRKGNGTIQERIAS